METLGEMALRLAEGSTLEQPGEVSASGKLRRWFSKYCRGLEKALGDLGINTEPFPTAKQYMKEALTNYKKRHGGKMDEYTGRWRYIPFLPPANMRDRAESWGCLRGTWALKLALRNVGGVPSEMNLRIRCAQQLPDVCVEVAHLDGGAITFAVRKTFMGLRTERVAIYACGTNTPMDEVFVFMAT